MKEVVIRVCGDGVSEILKEFLDRGTPIGLNELAGTDRGRFDRMKSVLGLERKRGEGGRQPAGKRVTDRDVVLTVRRDLAELRTRMLRKAGRRELLSRVDYTLDQMDNLLGEM